MDIGYSTGSCYLFHDVSVSTINPSVYILFTLIWDTSYALLRLHFILTFYGKSREGVQVDLDGDLATAMTRTGL